MIKYHKLLKKSEGFTLIEMLINLLIVSSVIVTMLFTFNQINDHNIYQGIKAEATYYSTNVLDMIVHEISRAKEVSYRTLLARTKIQCLSPQISYRNKNKEDQKDEIPRIKWVNTQIVIDLNSGAWCSHCTDTSSSAGSYFLDFNPKDNAGRTKYKLSKFKIEDVDVGLGDIFSDEAYDARESSRQLYLEVLLYKYHNQLTPSDTLRFTRRIFLPGLLVESTEESS